MEKKKSPLLIAAIVLLAVCLLINILLVGMYSGLNKNIEHLSYNIQLLREHSEIEEAVPNTEPAILATEPEVTESPEETLAEFSIQITKQPTSEVLSENSDVSSDTMKLLFHVKAAGEGLHFQWEKYDAEDNAWNIVVDDWPYDIINNKLSAKESESKLYLMSNDNSVLGQYRCCVTDMLDNCWVSDIVTVELSVDATPADTDSSETEQPKDTLETTTPTVAEVIKYD